MIKNTLIVLGLLIAVFLAVVALQPADYSVSRSATFVAAPSAVFSHVNDFHKWEAWSPWAKLDPAMKQVYEGAPAGVGAVYYWNGNKDVGEGRMTLTESRANERILIKLEFIKPFESLCGTEFTFKEEGGRTEVTWTMTGKNDFMGKAFGLFVNLDKMIGADFEKGFAQLKAVVEAKP